MKNDKKTGTREWSDKSINCLMGCEHDCRYCYARESALRFKQISRSEDWPHPVIRIRDVEKQHPKYRGVVMFPTQHDITPRNLPECEKVLLNLLTAGNQVLIVSKPHLQCIERLCRTLAPFIKQVMFRFSIGAMSFDIHAYWEPYAPSFDERILALQHAFTHGFETSVSCEPLLEPEHAVELFDSLKPFVTDSIWIGKMNKIEQRCKDCDPAEIARIHAGQTDAAVIDIYHALKDEPLVRWKESYQEVIDRHIKGK
jgi:DNA repair photolyase